MKRLTSLLLLLTIAIACQPETPTEPAKGTLKLIGNWAPDELSWRDIWVWTPPGYDSTQSYPVLYMHDGQMLFDSTSTWNHQEWQVDEWMEKLIAEGKIRPAIVVGIANGGQYRHTDYFPQDALDLMPEDIRDSIIQRDLMGKPRANRYVNFIVRELKPYIEEHYAASTKPTESFLMGSSMGGLISLYCTTRYPEAFGGAACLSTHWPGSSMAAKYDTIPESILAYYAANLPNPYATKLYFDHGTVGLDSLYAPYQIQMDSILKANDFVDSRGLSKVFEGATHDEHSWAARLDVPLIFLLGKDQH